MRVHDRQFETNELVKTLDIHPSQLIAMYRIEILRTTNPKEPFTANCYEDVEDDTGKHHWSRMSDFPWIGANDVDSAIAEALGWLNERLPD